MSSSDNASKSQPLLERIISTLEENKAEDLVSIPLKGKSEIADYMVIASGRSARQVTAMAEKLSDELKHSFAIMPKLEGRSQGDWVLVDAGDVVVHLFRPEVREFYQLEKLWQGASPADAG
ncbi:MAG: ribosome silencing factor [Rhodobacterales bacterium]|nr:MAG: ribosome silencing factor [Rhodobacterales bacterium]